MITVLNELHTQAMGYLRCIDIVHSANEETDGGVDFIDMSKSTITLSGEFRERNTPAKQNYTAVLTRSSISHVACQSGQRGWTCMVVLNYFVPGTPTFYIFYLDEKEEAEYLQSELRKWLEYA